MNPVEKSRGRNPSRRPREKNWAHSVDKLRAHIRAHPFSTKRTSRHTKNRPSKHMVVAQKLFIQEGFQAVEHLPNKKKELEKTPSYFLLADLQKQRETDLPSSLFDLNCCEEQSH